MDKQEYKKAVLDIAKVLKSMPELFRVNLIKSIIPLSDEETFNKLLEDYN